MFNIWTTRTNPNILLTSQDPDDGLTWKLKNP